MEAHVGVEEAEGEAEVEVDNMTNYNANESIV